MTPSITITNDTNNILYNALKAAGGNLFNGHTKGEGFIGFVNAKYKMHAFCVAAAKALATDYQVEYKKDEYIKVGAAIGVLENMNRK